MDLLRDIVHQYWANLLAVGVYAAFRGNWWNCSMVSGNLMVKNQSSIMVVHLFGEAGFGRHHHRWLDLCQLAMPLSEHLTRRSTGRRPRCLHAAFLVLPSTLSPPAIFIVGRSITPMITSICRLRCRSNGPPLLASSQSDAALSLTR